MVLRWGVAELEGSIAIQAVGCAYGNTHGKSSPTQRAPRWEWSRAPPCSAVHPACSLVSACALCCAQACPQGAQVPRSRRLRRRAGVASPRHKVRMRFDSFFSPWLHFPGAPGRMGAEHFLEHFPLIAVFRSRVPGKKKKSIHNLPTYTRPS